MSTHKHIDKICCVVVALMLLLTALLMNVESLGVAKRSSEMEYENRIFDTSKVHTIDIVMDDWDTFIDNCKSEEYAQCTVVIDEETYKNVAIRGKGNTSLTQVESYGNDRYSFKIEFDHYDDANSYYGLDKLVLNNIIQDNTYMKDYLTYQMMAQMGVASPLCSYAYLTVNGEDWGLYLALEAVEESFLQHNYGNSYGELYKPDSMDMGGGRGNGEKFDRSRFEQELSNEESDQGEDRRQGQFPPGNMPSENMNKETMPTKPERFTSQENVSKEDALNKDFQTEVQAEENAGARPEFPAGEMDRQADRANRSGGGGMHASDDVLLRYTDDEEESYSNIFNNAKTDVTTADKTRLITSLKQLGDATEDTLEETVDIDAVIRYFVVHNFVLNFDSYTGSMVHNYYLYEEDGQMQMIPWDYNLAFGGFQSMSDATTLVNYPIDSPVSGGDASERPMIAWIFENEAYTEKYHQLMTEFVENYFDTGYVDTMIAQVSELIAPYVEKDPTKFCTYEQFETGVTVLRQFCELRAQSISGQLAGTIGKTSDTQEQETLVDAGELQVTDMGSMEQTMGGRDKGQSFP